MMNPIARRFIQIGILIVIQALALFLAAGRLDWAEGWVYLGIYLAFIAFNAALMLPKGTALIEERSRTEIVHGYDRVVGVLLSLFGPGMLIVAGLDERFGWSPPFGLGVQAAGGIIMLLGDGLFGWAMSTNAYFSAVVRIQKERGHTVVTDGPYRWVRHPGYLGTIVTSLASPALLASLWAFIPAVLLAAAIVFRTVMEDKTLQVELEGYQDYAQRTRYRLIPGIW